MTKKYVVLKKWGTFLERGLVRVSNYFIRSDKLVILYESIVVTSFAADMKLNIWNWFFKMRSKICLSKH